MAMDIISGMVITTSALILAIALMGVSAARVTAEQSSRSVYQDVFARLRGMEGTLVVIYFVATTHLLLIAHQLSLALGNFVVGLILVVVQFIEPALRSGQRSKDEQDNWRR